MGDAATASPSIAGGALGGAAGGVSSGGSSGGFSLGGAAGPLSIASLGLGVFSSLSKGSATQAADNFQADKAERAADFGKLQAGLTDSVMREQLNTTLSNIDVIRAASRTDPTSPTGAAIESYDSKIANRQRTTALLNINSQVSEDEASANYLRQAGDFAVSQSYLDAGIKVAGAVGKAFV